MRLLNGQGDDKLDLFLFICQVYYNFSSIWLFIALNSLVYVHLLHKPLIYFQFLTTTTLCNMHMIQVVTTFFGYMQI